MQTQDTARNLFVTGLRNAHALENEAIELMQRQIGRLEHYPDVEARLRQHLEETRLQKQRIENILAALGTGVSTLKDVVMSFFGTVAAIGNALAGDEILKNCFTNFAFEGYEIAAYKSLIVLADATGHHDCIPPLDQSLREEQAMAAWLEQNLGPITLHYLSLASRGMPAKR